MNLNQPWWQWKATWIFTTSQQKASGTEKAMLYGQVRKAVLAVADLHVNGKDTRDLELYGLLHQELYSVAREKASEDHVWRFVRDGWCDIRIEFIP